MAGSHGIIADSRVYYNVAVMSNLKPLRAPYHFRAFDLVLQPYVSPLAVSLVCCLTRIPNPPNAFFVCFPPYYTLTPRPSEPYTFLELQ